MMRFAYLGAAVILLSGCHTAPPRGKKLVAWYGCASCHELPAAPVAGKVGPSLQGVGKRSYLAGRLANTPENLVRWIRFPHQVDASTVMPDMHVTESDARDIAEYLYALR